MHDMCSYLEPHEIHGIQVMRRERECSTSSKMRKSRRRRSKKSLYFRFMLLQFGIYNIFILRISPFFCILASCEDGRQLFGMLLLARRSIIAQIKCKRVQTQHQPWFLSHTNGSMVRLLTSRSLVHP